MKQLLAAAALALVSACATPQPDARVAATASPAELFGPLFADWLASRKPQTFSSRYAMVFYLMRSPLPEARAALDTLRAGGLL